MDPVYRALIGTVMMISGGMMLYFFERPGWRVVGVGVAVGGYFLITAD